MPNYQNGKIYAIKSYQTEKKYIGSTTQQLCVRLGKHRTDFKDNKGTAKNILQYDDYYIELIENYACNNKEELEQRERHYIQENINNCVNVRLPTRKQKEYRELNKDKKKEYDIQYRELNKDKIKQNAIQYQEENREILRQKKAEYNEANREIKNQKGIEYYEANREKILNLNKQKHICICGIEYTQGHKSRHEKTKKHQSFVNPN